MNPVIQLRQSEARALRIRALRQPGWHEALIHCMNEWESAKLKLAQCGIVSVRYTWADVMTPDPEPKGAYCPGPAEDDVEFTRRVK